MNPSDKTQFLASLNNLLAVYGKPSAPTGAAQIWWDTLKEFDHSQVFTEISYWPQYHGKPPVPSEIWSKLNEKRTATIEEKARVDRLENTGRKIPDGYGPTPAGRVMFRILKGYLNDKRKPIWHRVLDAYENGDPVPLSMLTWARNIQETQERYQ